MTEYKLGTITLNNSSVAALFAKNRIIPIRDLNHIKEPVPDTLLEIISDLEGWHGKFCEAADTVTNNDGFHPEDVEFRAPIESPNSLICIGTNYKDHLAEMKVTKLPDFPYGFLRPRNCLAAHKESIQLPNKSRARMIDWEAELGIVIGHRIQSGTTADLMEAVAGYTVINDISARDWIINRPHVGIDWVMQKAWDKFQPTGPWITPKCFVPNPQNLDLTLRVNSEIMQQSNTAQMVFGVEDILQHLSGIMTLEPGDIIATGTPAGVGFGRNPQKFIGRGDIVTVEIEGLGLLENIFH